MTQSNLKLNTGSVEIRKEGEEHTSYIASNKALLNIEQNIETLAEKISNFELKLNYVLLRQPKLTKKKKGFRQQHGMAKNNQQKDLNWRRPTEIEGIEIGPLTFKEDNKNKKGDDSKRKQVIFLLDSEVFAAFLNL